jgi:hypothetical protein
MAVDRCKHERTPAWAEPFAASRAMRSMAGISRVGNQDFGIRTLTDSFLPIHSTDIGVDAAGT